MRAKKLQQSIPSNWAALPLKIVCKYRISNVDKHTFEDEIPVRLCNYSDVYNNDSVSPQLDLMVATATEDELNKFHLDIGDIVITKDSESWNDIGVPAYVEATSEDFICGYHLAMIRPDSDVINGRFLFYCFQSRLIALQLELEATGVTRYGISKGAIGKVLIPLPIYAVQQLIADYLDRETARIDALIAEKENMLALLEEKRAAVISQAVTRGLDPDVPLKNSGLDWLREIPAHWDIQRLKFLADSLAQGSSPVASNTPAEADELGILKLSAVHKGDFRGSENKGLQNVDHDEHAFSLRAGDVLITRGNTPDLVGDVAWVPRDEPNLLIPDLIYRLRVKGALILPEYLAYFLTSRCARVQIQRDARGSNGSMVKISQEHVLNWRIPVPMITEQKKIVDTLIGMDQAQRRLREELLRSISLLKERRSALISTAITGNTPMEVTS